MSGTASTTFHDLEEMYIFERESIYLRLIEMKRRQEKADKEVSSGIGSSMKEVEKATRKLKRTRT